MPVSRAAVVTVRTDFAPSAWPSIRCLPLRSAQRPLPSMMISMWRGKGPVANTNSLPLTSLMPLRIRTVDCELSTVDGRVAALHFHDLLFLLGHHIFDLFHELV